MDTAFSYRHRVVTASDITFIRALIAEHPSASRRDPSNELNMLRADLMPSL